MAQRGSEERRAYWQDVMREQQASGMSVAAFCRQRGMALSSFHKWKRRLMQDGTASKGDRVESADRALDRTARQPMGATFVPLELPAPAGAARIGGEVVLPDGCRIIVFSHCDPRWLGEILQVVQERTC